MPIVKRGRAFAALLAACLLVLALGGSPAQARDAKPTIVLVHGAFADSSGWNPVIQRLQRASFPVLAPANPLRDLAGDAAYLSSVLDTIPGPVILVGHSYGGAVITNAARDRTNVKALVYLAAFAPDEGESALQLTGRFPGSRLPDSIIARPYPGGVDGYIDPAKFRPVFAADLPANTARLMAATQRPGSMAGLSAPSGAPAWKTIPSWYLVAGSDHAIPPAAQRFMAERAGSKKAEIGRSSHVVMLSHPDAATALILAAHVGTRT
ncbi:alpha/beta fold hydrolase [Nonomuraea ceibae]|uniref:alpha/beta fold hydrolase n=1 Tax=Nonomuraea ceibae TaxID=1935170 RepID=UPI001C5E80FD|nr:alpha/beta hydrolase [Nonomuraea ceibae]